MHVHWSFNFRTHVQPTPPSPGTGVASYYSNFAVAANITMEMVAVCRQTEDKTALTRLNGVCAVIH